MLDLRCCGGARAKHACSGAESCVQVVRGDEEGVVFVICVCERGQSVREQVSA